MSRRLPVLAALVAVLALLLPAVSSGANAVDTPGAGGMSPGFRHDLATLAPSAPYNAFVRVQDGLDAASVIADNASNVHVLRNYPLISAAFVAGPIGAIANLADVSSVEYVQDNAKLEWHNDTGTWASRSRIAQENVAGGPFKAGTGGPALTGAGVGVAVVDSGIFSGHPDLSGAVEHNFKFVCTTPGLISTETETCFGNFVVDDINGDPKPTFGFVDAGDTNSDTTSGHGTHVAGIIAGDGTMSTGNYPVGTGPNVKGTYTGVAPGASLYGYSSGEVTSVLFAVESLYHILVHGNTFTPRISVVNNSWGNPGGTAFDSGDIISKLTDDLVDNNVTMVFSASNDGGNGSEDLTSGYCKNPKAGVICVANYDDEANPGGRDGALDASSSRGDSGDTSTATFPDISAPGAFITSPCVREVQPVCNLGYVDEARWGPWYSSISGTSMAAPHITGVIALLLEADNAMSSISLTPASIENLLQDTAYKYAFGGAYVDDPQNPDDTSSTTDEDTSFDKGAGLVDVKAALTALGVPGTASPAFPLSLASGDGGDFAGPKVADIVSLTVSQATSTSGAPGFKYDVKVADVLDFGGLPSVSYRLFQNTQGVAYTITVVNAPAGASPSATQTPVGLSVLDVTRDPVTDVVSFIVPFSSLGSLPIGEPVMGVQLTVNAAPGLCLGSGCTSTVDAIPGNDPGLVTPYFRPSYAKPYARTS